MARLTRTLLALVFGSLLTLANSAQAQLVNPPGEAAPQADARRILPAEILLGQQRGYQVREAAPVVDYKYKFSIQTRWGEMQALGTPMLELRVRELAALEMAQVLTEDVTLVPSVVAQYRRQHEAPSDSPLLSAAGADMKPPKGFERIIQIGQDPQVRKAGDELRRTVAVRLGVDPETRNPIVAGVLDAVSRRGLRNKEALVASQIDASLPTLTLLQFSPELSAHFAKRTPQQIELDLAAELRELSIDGRACGRFSKDMNFTAHERLLYVSYLKHLKGVDNLGLIVDRLNDSTTQGEGLARLVELRMMAELHNREPLARVTDIGYPLAQTANGSAYLILAEDYLHLTPQVEQALDAYRKQLPGVPTVLLTAGRVSNQVRGQLDRHNISLLDNMREGPDYRQRLAIPNGGAPAGGGAQP